MSSFHYTYVRTYHAVHMSDQMSLLHFRKTSASRTASDILALHADMMRNAKNVTEEGLQQWKLKPKFV